MLVFGKILQTYLIDSPYAENTQVQKNETMQITFCRKKYHFSLLTIYFGVKLIFKTYF